MAAQAIDYSSGLVPAAPPQGGQAGSGVDYSAGLVPSASPSTNGAPAPAAPAASSAILENSAKEPVFRMSSDDGTEAGIPYSKIATGPALKAGWRFADPREEARFLHSYMHDPQGSFTKGLSYIMGQDPVLQFYSGVGGEALKTITGLSRFIMAALGNPAGQGAGQEAENDPERAAERPAQGMAEQAGALGENMAEFAGGDELLKAVSKGALSLGEAAKIEQEVKKGSKLGELALASLRQGAVAGGQTFAKTGGNVGAAATAAGATAATGIALGGAGAGLSRAVARGATTLENVGGVEMPVSAEVRNAAMTPEQRAGQTAIRGAAKSTAQAHLNELQESRTPPEGPLALPASTGPFEFNLKGVTPFEGRTGDIAHPAAKFDPATTHVVPGTEPGAQNRAALGSTATTVPERLQQRTQAYTTTAAGDGAAQVDEARGGGILKTQDANIARAHIANLNAVIDGPEFEKFPPAQQQNLLEARTDAQRQMAAYHEQVMQNLPNAQKPSLEPVDVPREVSRIGSYTDAANVLEEHAVRGYDVLNDATGGKFNAVRQELKDAWGAYTGASGEEAQAAAERGVDAAEGKMTRLLEGLRGVVDDRALDGFNDAFKNAQGLKRVAQAVDGSFAGNTSSSARSWEYRGFDGGRLMNNLSRLERKMGRGPLERLVGRDNLNTLYQVAELNRTQAQRARFGTAINAVKDALFNWHVGPAAVGGVAARTAGLPWEWGAGAGLGAAAATRKIMNAVLTNPQVARNLIFAIDSGARPENYGPFVAGLIVKASSQNGGAQ